MMQFLRETSPLKFIIISVILGVSAIFLEKAVPSLFLLFRILSFVLFIYGVIRLLGKK
jgi:hypothetical protein